MVDSADAKDFDKSELNDDDPGFDSNAPKKSRESLYADQYSPEQLREMK